MCPQGILHPVGLCSSIKVARIYQHPGHSVTSIPFSATTSVLFSCWLTLTSALMTLGLQSCLASPLPAPLPLSPELLGNPLNSQCRTRSPRLAPPPAFRSWESDSCVTVTGISGSALCSSSSFTFHIPRSG